MKQEVLNKIDELYTLLEETNEATEALNKQLSDKKKELETQEEKAIAKSKYLSASERIYKKYIDFDNEKKKFDAERKDYLKDKDEAEASIEESNILIADIDEENEKLDARKAAMAKQAIGLKEREAAFDKKKAELKGMLTGTAIKDMLK